MNIKDGFWVFGYGSLVWQPGFEFSESQIARMDGFSRSFCMWSIHHRGTEENPGLVLALDRADDAFCDGVAFFVPPETAPEALQYLRDRELISSAYLEEIHPILLRDGRVVDSVAYVINRDHVQYCGGMALEKQAEIIARSVGGRGPNTEYLYNTAEGLAKIGLSDPELDWLADRVRTLSA
ncbi:gamma-glutamylcyclotransferase [Amylibacter sp. IMCC11727]|uniref:gamma-glutamylcyclotransferase n=1 Tax=Amylibacter sp. IMCC11727 TaxID=3039851 RepID=UPI00244E4D42|nr:gamma-glutamylcyclotransferase [Amylibacter sp. IMCC11727]WGI22550.1 gamma-glutamylcyclotransferase [Amylibacter sp. IMCC11727]